MKKYFIAIDLGGTSAKCALVSLDGTVKPGDEFSVLTLVDYENENSNKILENLDQGIQYELNKRGLNIKDDIKAITLAVPGQYNFQKQTVVLGPNINWKNYPIVEEAKKIWPNQDIYCLNDAEAAVLGQCFISKEPNVILYILGTGVGTSVTQNAQLIFQENEEGIFSVGEFAHRSKEMPLSHSDIQCGCGIVGCLETVASAKAINKKLNECENLTEEEMEEVNKFKKEQGLKELNTIHLNEFVKDVKEEHLRFTIFRKMLDQPLTELAKSMKSLYEANPDFNNHSWCIAGGGAKMDQRFLDILQDKLNDDSLMSIKIQLCKDPDKLGLKGVINYSLNQFSKEAIKNEKQNKKNDLKNEQEYQLVHI